MNGPGHTSWRSAAIAAAVLALVPAAGQSAEPTREQVDFFEKKIRPVLIAHCYRCHSTEANKAKGGLLLDTRDALRKGGKNGPAIVAGDPTASPLIAALRYEGPKMPPAGKLPPAVLADFETWVRQGAPDPRVIATASKPTGIDLEAGKQFWAFQPPHARELPPVKHAGWPRQRLDRFLLARLEQAGLEPAAPAERRTWIRRVTFDLTGLPPTPDEVESFVEDNSPQAEERVVDRLLASPHFGERWARVWLDVARYAEDQAHIVGKDESLFYPNAYLYRNWVIAAFNADMPYDRFVTLQLAADTVEGYGGNDLAALGFLGLGPKYYNRGNPAVMADEWEDRVDVVGRGLLGLTVACARCHDHKYDPIPTSDYYALAGIFASTRMYNRPLNAPMGKEADDVKNPKEAMHIVREGKPTDLNVFVRGDVNNKGAVAERHFLSVLCAGPPQPFHEGSGRLQLAQAIVNPQNPLTARVIVNRIWGQMFGRAIVGTPSNFGSLGERPTHPELLDDLAVRFVESGWSLKWLVREIALSTAYRQSCAADARALAADPENRLLGRMSRRRLTVEEWRDAILAATGRLDGAVGVPSMDPQDPKERRRTVYSAVSRLDLNRMLALFDFPDPNVHADRRAETTTPLQKLFVLNSPFMEAQAEALAERLHVEVPNETPQAERKRLQRAYTLLFGRPATDTEERLGLAFLREGGDPATRWRNYAHVLLAANELLFLD